MTRRVVMILLALILLVAMALFTPVSELTLMLVFGWLFYLAQVLRDITLRWDGVVFFLLSLTVFTVLVHQIASWLRREMSDHTSVWRWRATLQIVGLVIMAFVAGLAMVGVTHQVTWILADDAPLLVPTFGGHFGGIISRNPFRSSNNLKYLAMNVHNYHDLYKSLPTTGHGDLEQNWFTHASLFGTWILEIDQSKPWDHADNQPAIRKLVPQLLNPNLRPAVLRDANGYGVSHYAGNTHLFDAFERLAFRDISDGTGNTLMIGEVNATYQPWAKPRSNRDPALGVNRSPLGFGGPAGQNGAQFAMVDGSVRFIASDIDPTVLAALGTPNDGEPVEDALLNP